MRFAGLILALAGCTAADAAPTAPAPAAPAKAPAPVPAGSGSAAKAPKVPCTAKAIGEVRKQAELEMRAGHTAAAITLLETVACWIDRDQPAALQTQIAWRLSDLAFAHFKAGDFGSCYSIASAEATPYSGNVASVFDEDDAVVKALMHNAELCHDAEHKARGTFTPAAKCALQGDYGIPTAIASGGGCLAIGESHKDSENLLVCGNVFLVQKSGGKIVRRALDVTKGNLAEGSICCNIHDVSFAKRGASWAVRVSTLGRDCNGGTASSEEEHEYELSGTKLTLVHTFGATAH